MESDEVRDTKVAAFKATLDGDLEGTLEQLQKLDRPALFILAEQNRQLAYAAENVIRQMEAPA